MSDRFKKEESAAERDFINKQEREMLKALLKRMGHPEQQQTSDDALVGLLQRHKVTAAPELIKDLKVWKESH